MDKKNQYLITMFIFAPLLIPPGLCLFSQPAVQKAAVKALCLILIGSASFSAFLLIVGLVVFFTIPSFAEVLLNIKNTVQMYQ